MPTSVAMEKNDDKDPAGPVPGTVTAAAHWRSRSEERACFQHIFEVRKLTKKNNLRTTCDFLLLLYMLLPASSLNPP